MDMLKKPQIECIESSKEYAKYRIKDLDNGYGMILGNSIKRTLLKSENGSVLNVLFNVNSDINCGDVLELEIITNGHIEPSQALINGVKNLSEMLSLFIYNI